jgi:hypothetical protein
MLAQVFPQGILVVNLFLHFLKRPFQKIRVRQDLLQEKLVMGLHSAMIVPSLLTLTLTLGKGCVAGPCTTAPPLAGSKMAP